MSSILFDSYHGLGDQVWLRPFIFEAKKKYDTVHVVTDFPGLLYDGTGIGPVYKKMNLKTQTECARLECHKFVDMLPKYDRVLRPNYTAAFHADKNKTITRNIEEQIRITPREFHTLQIKEDWIKKARWLVRTEKPICFIRLPSVRDEWANSSRNGKMAYFKYVIENMIGDENFKVSSLDLRGGKEHLDGPMPKVDLQLHENELGIDGMLGLLKISSFCVSIQCMTLPICADIGTPLFIIYGGYAHHGFHADPRLGLKKIVAVQPPVMCNCLLNKHTCNKDIDPGVLSRSFKHFMSTCVEATKSDDLYAMRRKICA